MLIAHFSHRIALAGLAIALFLQSEVPAQQNDTISIVSAADYRPVISPNSLATIFGQNLSRKIVFATLDANGALPTSLDGTSLTIGGKAAPLVYVSPLQINFLVPADTPIGAANVTIRSLNSQSPITGSVSIATVAPGLFTVPCLRPTRGAILNGVTYSMEPFQALTTSNPANDKRTRLSIFGTGLRYSGNVSRDSSHSNVASAVKVEATDLLGAKRDLAVEYAGAAPKYAGLDQVNVVIPIDLEGAGLVSIRLTSGNAVSNPVSFILSQSLAAGLPGDPTFNIMTVAGRTGLPKPSAVALDRDHNIYIASGENHVVQKVSTNGTITTFAGTGAAGSAGDGGSATKAQLITPAGLAMDRSGNLYIADSASNKIRRVARDGTITTYAGTGTTGFAGDGGPATVAELSSPTAISFDPHGALIIADTGNSRIRKITSDGLIYTFAGRDKAGFSGDGGPAYLAELNAPDSVAVSADGTMYVADEGSHRIRRIEPDGTIRTIAGGPADSQQLPSLTFESPIHLALDDDQRLFVSDSLQARIRVMNSACQINSVAGNGIAGFSGDGGAAVAAELNQPSSLAVDSSGDVYFADSSNNRVRRLYRGGCGIPPAIVLNPERATSGTEVDGSIRMACPAAGETVLALSSDRPGLQLPSTVTVAAGQTNASFSFRVLPLDAPVSFRVTASNSKLSASGTLSAQPATEGNSNVPAMTLLPSSQFGGGPVTGIVTGTSPAPVGGSLVNLQSDASAARVAPTVLIPEGQRDAEFLIATSPVTQPVNATIQSAGGSINGSATLSLVPAGRAIVSSLSISPSVVTGGQSAIGSMTLESPMAGAVQVDLSSSDPTAGVPASVIVPPGQTLATFPVSTSEVASPGSANIIAASANLTSSRLIINPPSGDSTATIASFSISPSSVTGGQSATGTVRLETPAPSGGVAVNLASDNSSVSVPLVVTVPVGQTSATFAVTTSAVSSPTAATVTASSANSISAALTVSPSSGSGGPIAGLSISPSTLTGGQAASGTVTLNAPAPNGGTRVTLSSNSAAATVPASVTVPAGETAGTFAISTANVSSPTAATVTATSAGSTASATITVNPASNAACVSNIKLSLLSVIGGGNVDGTVHLTSAAQAGGQAVNLSSSSASASVPATVTVPAGQTSAGFTVKTKPVLALDTPIISANTGACAAATAALNVTPPGN